MNEQQKPLCFGREYHGVCPNDNLAALKDDTMDGLAALFG